MIPRTNYFTIHKTIDHILGSLLWDIYKSRFSTRWLTRIRAIHLLTSLMTNNQSLLSIELCSPHKRTFYVTCDALHNNSCKRAGPLRKGVGFALSHSHSQSGPFPKNSRWTWNLHNGKCCIVTGVLLPFWPNNGDYYYKTIGTGSLIFASYSGSRTIITTSHTFSPEEDLFSAEPTRNVRNSVSSQRKSIFSSSWKTYTIRSGCD